MCLDGDHIETMHSLCAFLLNLNPLKSLRSADLVGTKHRNQNPVYPQIPKTSILRLHYEFSNSISVYAEFLPKISIFSSADENYPAHALTQVMAVQSVRFPSAHPCSSAPSAETNQ